MTAPSVNFTIQSNGLGNVASSTANVVAVLGCSSGGTAAAVKGPYALTSNLVTDVGYGPGVELAANLIQSGISTIFVKVATTTPGAASAVTHAGTGASVMTVTGAPVDLYDVIVTIVRAGTAGTDPEPGFTVSFDGGRTTSREIRMPTNHIYSGFAATTGVTLNFTAASLAVGDTYKFTTTPPVWAAADVATALDALKASSLNASLLYVVGAAAKADADTIATSLNAFVTRKKFERLVLEARDIDTGTSESEATWIAALNSDYATFLNDRVSVAAGYAIVPSSISKIAFRRSMGQLAIVRAGLARFGRDLGAVADGPLVPSRTGQPTSEVFHDEALNPGLDSNRFMTLTSFNGRTGYYVTNANLMCGPTSDFTLLQYGRVMDRACSVADQYFTGLLGEDVRLDRKTGYILEKDAKAIETASDQKQNDALVATNNASFVKTTLSRVDNISTTKTLTVTIEILPKGYIKTVSITMTFVNPVFGSLAA